MNKGIIYTLFAGVVFLISSCSGEFQKYDLSEEYATSIHYEGMSADDKPVEEEGASDLVGIPGRTFYNGDLMRGAIWFGGKGVSLDKGEVYTLETFNVGSDSLSFGATFPPLDLVSEPVMLQVSAMAIGTDTIAPVLYLQLSDANGNLANASMPAHKIVIGNGFLDYYFDLRDIYTQLSPKRKVNGKLINSLKFYINPGKDAYTGKILIQEIKIVPANSVGK